MTTDTNTPGTAWMQIVKKNGTSDFAASFTADARLQASALSKAVVGPTLNARIHTHESSIRGRRPLKYECTLAIYEGRGTSLYPRFLINSGQKEDELLIRPTSPDMK